MIKWELLDTAPVPDGGGEMRLMRRGHELVIRVDGQELMSNRMHGSENALSSLACDHLQRTDAALSDVDILIGGLGIGFTLAAALERVGGNAKVTVAELVPAVVEWNRGALGEAAGHPIRDPRTTVHIGDVAELIRGAQHRWDAILLDVDNGPDGLTKSSNDWLYTIEGLTAAKRALKPGGVLGVWSAAPDDAFTRRLGDAGFRHVEPVRVRARGAKGGRRHIVWICTR